MLKEKITKMLLPFYLLNGLLLFSCLLPQQPLAAKLPVIFETDMGNDIDDALALAMLFRYADQGEVDLLGIVNNKASLSSVQFLDIMRRQYGYPALPIATVYDGVEGEAEQNSFARKLLDHRQNGETVFKSDLDRYDRVDSAINLYRRLLAAAEDHSVVVISVGFSTNLAQLLTSPPDAVSPLIGYDLVKQKVKYLSTMAGSFTLQPRHREFNIISDIPSAQTVFTNWPTPIYVSPFEVGNAIRFPADAIIANLGYKETHPLVEAYKLYIPMPYSRETWDLTSVLYAIEPRGGYFRRGPQGQITVDDKGYTDFQHDPRGKHCYLLAPTTEEIAKIERRFVELIKAP